MDAAVALMLYQQLFRLLQCKLSFPLTPIHRMMPMCVAVCSVGDTSDWNQESFKHLVKLLLLHI